MNDKFLCVYQWLSCELVIVYSSRSFCSIGENKINSLMCMIIRSVAQCAEKAAVQEKIALDVWLPELKGAVQEAQRCLDDCKRVRGLVSWSKLL